MIRAGESDSVRQSDAIENGDALNARALPAEH